MTEPMLRNLATPSPFDEARAEISRWEKEYPNARRICLIVDDPDMFEYTVTGSGSHHEVAGLFQHAAWLVWE